MVPQESSRKISEQAGRVIQKRESPEWHARHLSRRSFIRRGQRLTAVGPPSGAEVLSGRGWIQPANQPDLVHHTYNGLLAFVVPGDPYSVQQRVRTEDGAALMRASQRS